MAVIGRTGVHHPRRNNAPMTTITMSGSLLTSCADTMGPVTTPTRQASLRQLTRSLERDDFSSNRHPALSFCLSMIFSENRYPPSGRARGHAFPDHALAALDRYP